MNSDGILTLLRFLQKDTVKLCADSTSYCRLEKSEHNLQELVNYGKVTHDEAIDKVINILTHIGKLNFYVINVQFSNVYLDPITQFFYISDDSIFQKKTKDCSVFNCLAFEYNNLSEKYGAETFKKFTEDFLRHNVM